MAEQAEMTVKISADGQSVETDVHGFSGSGCKDFTKKVVADLGEIKDQGQTEDFYKTNKAGVHIG